MTKQQYKIYSSVLKHKKLGKVLSVTGISDYIKLQEIAGVNMLEFSDVRYDDNTDVSLSTKATEEYEKARMDFLFKAVGAVAAVTTAVISVIGLITSQAK